VHTHRQRLEALARADAAGLTGRRVPEGHLERDSVAGREAIAEALATLELAFEAPGPPTDGRVV
jgi:hypothetical protein